MLGSNPQTDLFDLLIANCRYGLVGGAYWYTYWPDASGILSLDLAGIFTVSSRDFHLLSGNSGRAVTGALYVCSVCIVTFNQYLVCIALTGIARSGGYR